MAKVLFSMYREVAIYSRNKIGTHQQMESTKSQSQALKLKRKNMKCLCDVELSALEAFDGNFDANEDEKNVKFWNKKYESRD